MPRKKQDENKPEEKSKPENKKTKKKMDKENQKIKTNGKKDEYEIDESLENEEQNIELEEELNIDSLNDLEDLEDLEDEYNEMENTDFFISEDDLIICPSCGEVIEVERLRLLEECPSCGLSITEFEDFEKYQSLYQEKEEDEEW